MKVVFFVICSALILNIMAQNAPLKSKDYAGREINSFQKRRELEKISEQKLKEIKKQLENIQKQRLEQQKYLDELMEEE